MDRPPADRQGRARRPASAGISAIFRKVRWLALSGVGAIVAVILVAAVFDVATTRDVGVVNPGSNDLRVSSCVDDALDLSAGQSSKIEVPKSARIGCDVFMDQKYAGCLVLQPRDTSAVDIVTRLDRLTSQGSCEKIG